jgi:serine/threonine protein phosphatase PrpC
MAAAAAAVLCRGARATVANLGDVRVYLATERWAARITADDTALSAALLDPSLSPDDRAGISGSILTEYLGRWRNDADGEFASVDVMPHIGSVSLVSGHSLVVTSDGLHGAIQASGKSFEDVLLEILKSSDSAQVAAFRLMSMANAQAGTDNISCIVCRCLPRQSP